MSYAPTEQAKGQVGFCSAQAGSNTTASAPTRADGRAGSVTTAHQAAVLGLAPQMVGTVAVCRAGAPADAALADPIVGAVAVGRTARRAHPAAALALRAAVEPAAAT